MKITTLKSILFQNIFIYCILFVSGCATTINNSGVIPHSSKTETDSLLQPHTIMRGIGQNDLLSNIRHKFALPDFNSNLVIKYENWYRTHPNALPQTLAKAEWSLPWVYNQVLEAELPTEIALLPIIESGYNPTVRSAQNAQGLWQLVKVTGKHYGLERNQWIDERRDLEKSTKAALTYITELNRIFDGDWLLTLAAYNSGQGRIRKQISKNIAQGGSGSYEELDLIKETKHFVPKLIALRNVIRNPYKFSNTLPVVPANRKFVNVAVLNQLSHKTIARFCNTEHSTITILNAAHQQGKTPPGKQLVRIPQHCESRFLQLAKNYKESKTRKIPINPTHRYIVKRGDSLWKIARINQTTVNSILKDNPALKSSKLQPGQTLLLHSNAKNRNKKKTYTIKSGDTLSYIAQLFQVTPAKLASWNNIDLNGILKLGQKLLIY